MRSHMATAVMIEIIVGADQNPTLLDARRHAETFGEFARRAIGQHRHGAGKRNARRTIAAGFS